jgi:ribosomal protein L29
MKKQDMLALSFSRMKEVLEDTRRELFSMRLNATTARVKDYSLFKKKRKEIAQLLTYMKQRSHLDA